ncbi:MAG: adenylate/guanylate cyclase domain-containing protein [Chitinophagaceae bacterium]
MEINIAILMADLSGYTAMTEIHGAESAAAMVDRYLTLVNKSLVGDSHLHERIGDQVVIISSQAEQLAYTATFLFEFAHEQEDFLPLHAALHYGPVVKKDNAYFGSTINTAARIMSAADKGKILCSADFLDQLPQGHSFAVKKIGLHQFKNLLQQVDLFELDCCITNLSKTFVIDPVCHMLLKSPAASLQLKHDDTIHYFCSEKCRALYKKLYMADET